jgi:ketosteroid isomerase-like protein
MSQENVETIRAFYDVYSRGDFDALPKPLHPDIEVILAGNQTSIKGAAQVRAWIEPDAFASQVIEPLSLRDLGNRVLVRAHTKIRGAGSGIEAEFPFWAVWTINEAAIPTRVEIYLDHQKAEALEAAGLRKSAIGHLSRMSVGIAIAVGVVIGLALGIVVSLTTDVPLAPEVGAVLGGLVGWLSGRDRREYLEAAGLSE